MNVSFLREVSIFRPFPNEVPIDILQVDGPLDRFQDVIDGLQEPARPVGKRGPLRVQELKFLRVAKHSERSPDEVIGVYVVRARSLTEFDLDHLYVDPSFRGRGLGRWLMGHAIGMSESKGGRILRVAGHHQSSFLARYGLARTEQGWQLEFIPE